ncbi:unnamed protein product [Thlaspi arvense]|uniref:Reverse transcriptase zinc-binding domain-containing protein n=1 Tax=Thlaspi arvense TaxID=13288 RepID=A0AAU9SAS2_THLAR|nr:unnamed protein product [Thlaspi arvense]
MQFWKDNWTSLGPLLDITGVNGPRVTGLPADAVVSDALRDGDWWVYRSRSRHPIIELLKDCLPSSEVVSASGGKDTYMWKVGNKLPSNRFSAAETWHFLNPSSIIVDWHEAIWFKENIPKHAFLAWVATPHRLHTRDRLLRWGMPVPSVCLLCNSLDESRQHIFFECPYNTKIWYFFTSRVHVAPFLLFEDGVRWMKDPNHDKNMSLILKFTFQASLYMISKERNARLHLSSARPPSARIVGIQNTICYRLDSLSRNQRNLPSTVSLLSTWFNLFQN